jgi:pimeloyl-ACP methyl ester carboxylesterase
LFILGIYLVVCALGGVYLADGTLHPARRPLRDEEAAAVRDDFRAFGSRLENASITTPDAAILQAWLVQPSQSNGNAVLLLHGLGDNRLGMTGYAQLLLAHGFAVLLPDARAHGVSGGSLATYGLIERNDIYQWVEFLRTRVRPRCVYGLGESMGAAQLLQALETGAQFCAVAAESPFANFREIAYDRMGQPFHRGPWLGRIVLRPLVEFAFLRARWKYGLDLQTVSPIDATTSTHVPVLLIHGQIDGNIPVRHSQLIHLRNPETILWEVPGADHCGAFATAPGEFEKRLLNLFTHVASGESERSSTTKVTK